MPIRLKIDEAKMNETWECELPDDEFNFICGNKAEVNDIWWENVHVFRNGKREQVLASMELTTEDQIEMEAEISRKKREELEKQGGRLKRPELANYHPKHPEKSK